MVTGALCFSSALIGMAKLALYHLMVTGALCFSSALGGLDLAPAVTTAPVLLQGGVHHTKAKQAAIEAAHSMFKESIETADSVKQCVPSLCDIFGV